MGRLQIFGKLEHIIHSGTQQILHQEWAHLRRQEEGGGGGDVTFFYRLQILLECHNNVNHHYAVSSANRVVCKLRR